RGACRPVPAERARVRQSTSFCVERSRHVTCAIGRGMTEMARPFEATETPIDSVPGTIPEPAKLGVRRGWLHRGFEPGRAAYSGGRRRSVNRRRRQFSLLVMRGDGVRVVRF